MQLLPPIGHANNSPTPPRSLEKASGKEKKKRFHHQAVEVVVGWWKFSENLFYIASKLPLPRSSAVVLKR